MTAKEQREAAKELAKREAELAEAENYFSELVSMLGYKPAMRMIEVR